MLFILSKLYFDIYVFFVYKRFLSDRSCFPDPDGYQP
jgi:hypothetical protein